MMNSYEINDGYTPGLCTRHAEPRMMTHVHTSEALTDDDLDIILRHPGMYQQECIAEFQERDFDAYKMYQNAGYI